MSLLSRIKAAWAAFNRYEAAQPSSPKRSYVPGFVRDARYDANSFTRWEMTRKIRDLSANVWLLQRLNDEFVKWTVGPNGLPIIPASSNPQWNARMQESYLEWCESPWLDSTLTMGQGHRLMSSSFGFEGEAFINFTRRKPPGRQSIPAVQLIESHRCSSPGMEYSVREDQDVVDGVQLERGPDGRPTKPSGYWVRDGFDGSAWTFRSVDQMHHIFDPERIGMFRGITPYHATINTLLDLYDLEDMEMERAKQNSEIAYLVKTVSGEMNANMVRRNRYLGSAAPVQGSSDDDLDKRVQMYRKVLGSRVVAGRKDEDWQSWNQNNPSAATQWYWRYKIGQVCSAAGVPLILVFPELVESIQGTVVRGIYDNAHMFFRGKFFVFAHAAIRMYRFYAGWARYNVPGLVGAPADWMKCHVIPPRAVNVDIGRNSAATLAELAAGITNYDDVAGANGSTAEVLLRKKARNIKLIREIAAEEGIEPAEIAEPLADVIQKLAAADASGRDAGDDDDDSEPVKPRKTVPA